jgi:hypothetical protein
VVAAVSGGGAAVVEGSVGGACVVWPAVVSDFPPLPKQPAARKPSEEISATARIPRNRVAG